MPLRDYQVLCNSKINESFKRYGSTLVQMATGCHRAGQKVLTWEGTSRNVETISVGEYVMGYYGAPRQVLRLIRGRGVMVAIIPVKGEPWIVNEDHILSLVRTRTRPCDKKHGTITDVSVKEWMTWSRGRKHIHKLFRSPVCFGEPHKLRVHPYLLGIMLGDGSFRTGSPPQVTTADNQIENYFRQQASEFDLNVSEWKAGGKSKTFLATGEKNAGPGCNRLIEEFKKLGLRNISCHEKFIPHKYKTSSRRDRLEILAGLLDTDGSLAYRNCYDFVSKSEELANDVAFVARSLGFAAYVTPCEKCSKTGTWGIYYRLCISGETDSIPCRLIHKQASERRQKKDVLRTGFSVEVLGEEEFFGFTLDGDGRYLLDDFTVTHNCGKTETFLTLAHESPGRTMIVAHTDELIRQPAERYQRMFGEEAGIEKGSIKVREKSVPESKRKRVIVTTVQTMCRENRHQKFNPNDFSRLIIDECHRGRAKSYGTVIDYFRQNKELKVLGLTATPKRTDRLALGQRFESVSFQYGIESGISDGWLVPMRQHVVKVDDLDFSRVRTISGDLDKEQLEKILIEEKMLHSVAAPAVELCGDKPTLVFCVSCMHADMMSKVLDRYKTGSAKFITGDRKQFPLKERHNILDAFRRGEFQYLCACNLLIEGFDAPIAANLVMARMTKSLLVYEQALGRITRRYGVSEDIATAAERKVAILNSPKPFGTVFDFVGVAGEHVICQASDILGGKYGVPVRDYAKRTLLDEANSVDIDEALDRASQEMELEAEDVKWAERREVVANEAKFRTEAVSPFGGGGGSPMPRQEVPHDRPTEKQIKYILFLADRAGEGNYWTRERVERLSSRQASGIIAKLREKAGV